MDAITGYLSTKYYKYIKQKMGKHLREQNLKTKLLMAIAANLR